MVFCWGTCASTVMVFSSMLSSTIRSIRRKYSSCIVRRWCALGGDQFVDSLAEVFEDKVLLGGGLAVVDLLCPLFQRQLDAECLVDRKGDIQKVQAVDPQVVDRVAVGSYRIPRNVAGFRDNVGDLVEGGRHH